MGVAAAADPEITVLFSFLHCFQPFTSDKVFLEKFRDDGGHSGSKNVENMPAFHLQPKNLLLVSALQTLTLTSLLSPCWHE